PHARAEHGENQPQRGSGRPQQKQAEYSEYRRDSVQDNYDLAVRHAELEQLVMDVLAIRGEDRFAADQTTKNRKDGLQNRQTERDHRNGHGDDSGRFLGTLQRESAQHEPDEQASAIAEKNRCRVKVVPEETKNSASQGDGQQRDKR